MAVTKKTFVIFAVVVAVISMALVFTGFVTQKWATVKESQVANIGSSLWSINNIQFGTGTATVFTDSIGLWRACYRIVFSDPAIADEYSCAYVNTGCYASVCYTICTPICSTFCVGYDVPFITNCAGYVTSRVFSTIAVIILLCGACLSVFTRIRSSEMFKSSGLWFIVGGVFLVISFSVFIGTNLNSPLNQSEFYQIDWSLILIIVSAGISLLIGLVLLVLSRKVAATEPENAEALYEMKERNASNINNSDIGRINDDTSNPFYKDSYPVQN